MSLPELVVGYGDEEGSGDSRNWASGQGPLAGCLYVVLVAGVSFGAACTYSFFKLSSYTCSSDCNGLLPGKGSLPELELGHSSGKLLQWGTTGERAVASVFGH